MARRKLVALSAAIGLLVAASTAVLAQAPAENLTDGCVESFAPGVDYFPDKVTVDFATNFTVEYFGTYKIVTVNEPFPGGAPETYVLVQCGAPAPELAGDLATAEVIQVPLPSIFSASSTHNPMIEALDLLDRLTGVGTLAFTANEAIIAAGAAGRIIEFAPTGTVNAEIVIAAHPAALMTGGGDDPAFRQIRDADIPVVANAEWLETDILGRSEWIKYIALFFNAEAVAQETFELIEGDYATAAAAAATIPETDRPLVLGGATFQGTFYAAGGQGYVAQAIAAAGGRYVFADNPEIGGLAFGDLEIVLDRGAAADVWINAATTYLTLADIVAEEPRLAALPVAQNGQVWIYDRLQTSTGAIGYWELGVLRPDLVLKDLIKIFHPELMADHEFVFYRPIEVAR